ncbi:hypothetical protein FRC02_005065 [Tulasnella sp. 418]|nr:hypothetical protein FRC02_005065 [Tulasnella sp. 418]
MKTKLLKTLDGIGVSCEPSSQSEVPDEIKPMVTHPSVAIECTKYLLRSVGNDATRSGEGKDNSVGPDPDQQPTSLPSSNHRRMDAEMGMLDVPIALETLGQGQGSECPIKDQLNSPVDPEKSEESTGLGAEGSLTNEEFDARRGIEVDSTSISDTQEAEDIDVEQQLLRIFPAESEGGANSEQDILYMSGEEIYIGTSPNMAQLVEDGQSSNEDQTRLEHSSVSHPSEPMTQTIPVNHEASKKEMEQHQWPLEERREQLANEVGHQQTRNGRLKEEVAQLRENIKRLELVHVEEVIRLVEEKERLAMEHKLMQGEVDRLKREYMLKCKHMALHKKRMKIERGTIERQRASLQNMRNEGNAMLEAANAQLEEKVRKYEEFVMQEAERLGVENERLKEKEVDLQEKAANFEQYQARANAQLEEEVRKHGEFVMQEAERLGVENERLKEKEVDLQEKAAKFEQYQGGAQRLLITHEERCFSESERLKNERALFKAEVERFNSYRKEEESRIAVERERQIAEISRLDDENTALKEKIEKIRRLEKSKPAGGNSIGPQIPPSIELEQLDPERAPSMEDTHVPVAQEGWQMEIECSKDAGQSSERDATEFEPRQADEARSEVEPEHGNRSSCDQPEEIHLDGPLPVGEVTRIQSPYSAPMGQSTAAASSPSVNTKQIRAVASSEDIMLREYKKKLKRRIHKQLAELTDILEVARLSGGS